MCFLPLMLLGNRFLCMLFSLSYIEFKSTIKLIYLYSASLHFISLLRIPIFPRLEILTHKLCIESNSKLQKKLKDKKRQWRQFFCWNNILNWKKCHFAIIYSICVIRCRLPAQYDVCKKGDWTHKKHIDCAFVSLSCVDKWCERITVQKNEQRRWKY